jgi:Tfp pilus assembly protein PilO
MNLTQREKIIVIAGIVGLGLLLSFQVFVRPALSRTKTLKRVVSEKREKLADLLTKSKEYNSLQKQLEQLHKTIANQQKDKKMLSLIEGIQRDNGLSKNVVSMTPTTIAISDIYKKTNVEIKYEAVTWKQMTEFLLKIKSSDILIGIRSLEIKRSMQDMDSLDFVIQLVNISNIEQN